MLWRKKESVKLAFGLQVNPMKWEWFDVSSCKRVCMEIVNHAPNMNSTTPKTAHFDGNSRTKRCGTVIPHRDCSRGKGVNWSISMV